MNKEMQERMDWSAQAQSDSGWSKEEVDCYKDGLSDGSDLISEHHVKPLVEALAFYCEIDTEIKGIGRVDSCAREALKRLGFLTKE